MSHDVDQRQYLCQSYLTSLKFSWINDTPFSLYDRQKTATKWPQLKTPLTFKRYWMRYF